MINKSRDIAPYLGDLNGLYYPGGMMRTVYSLPIYSTEQFIADRYTAGMAAAYYQLASAPSELGAQQFVSTERKRPYYNEVTNIRWRHMNLPYACIFRNYAQSGNYYWDYAFWRDPQWTGYIQPATPFTDWSALENMRSSAWWSMQPRFEGEISMLNFLFELKDFKFLLKHAMKIDYRHLADGFRRLKTLMHRYARSMYKSNGTKASTPIMLLKFLNWSTRALAQAHLTKEFMIDPTISDVMKIHAQMGIIVRQAQEEFFERGQTPQSSHYSQIISESNDLYQSSDNYYRYKTGTSYEAKFTATMSYTYQYAMRSDIDALLHYWGLVPNAKALWDMIPFSFVVDYFIRIGKSLDAVRNDPNVDFRLNQYCESTLVTSRGGRFTSGDSRIVNWVVNGKYYPGATQGIQLSGFDSQAYQRRLVKPNKGLPLPEVKLPSIGQRTNLIALVRCFM